MPAFESSSRLRWYIVALLFFTTFINYLDRQALSMAAPLLTKEFSLTERDYAHVVMAFLVAYCVMQAIAGKILDWIGVRIGLLWAVILWSLAGVAHAFTLGAFSLGVYRFLLGAFEAANYPAGIKAVSERFRVQERTIATGIFSAGSGLGAIAAPPFIAWLIISYGWKMAFIVPGLMGLLWVVPWMIIYPRDNPAAGDAGQRRDLSVPVPVAEATDTNDGGVRAILRRREFWGIVFARVLTDPVWWFYVFWLPKYLASERGFDLARIAQLAWIPFLGAGIFSVIGGFIPAFFMRLGVEAIRARKIAMLMSACVMPFAMFALSTPSALAAILFIAIATSGHNAWTSSLLTLPADLFPKRTVATAYGITAAGGTLGGILMSAFVGEMLSGFGYTPVFAVVSSLHVIAAIVIFITVRTKTV